MENTLELTDMVDRIKNPLSTYRDGEKTQSIYLKQNGDTFYVICSKDNFKECTFFATVDNVSYVKILPRDEFYMIKEYIKKCQSTQKTNN